VLAEPLEGAAPLPPVSPVVLPVLEERPELVVAPLLRCLLVVPFVELEAVPAAPVVAPEPPAEPVELVGLVLWLLSALVCAGAPEGAVSAWASPVPLASAAPRLSVTAPAPSQLDVSRWRRCARRRAFLASAVALARFLVRCLPAIAVLSRRCSFRPRGAARAWVPRI
jgi:hypothetical protein